MAKHSFAVLGAGSWGTALALHLAHCGHPVSLWGRDGDEMQLMQKNNCNHAYLPDDPFPEKLSIEVSLEKAVKSAEFVLLATPSHSFASMLEAIRPFLTKQKLLSATKGLYQGKLLHDVAAAILPETDYALLSGPSFAKEVASELPTTVIIASENERFAEQLAEAFSGKLFRAYTNSDIIGVEVGGAVKNVLAVAVGISDGLGFGANARAALITRGLAEMTRLGEALGANAETLRGLSGLGDLVLTCTDNQSRNRRFGLAIGEGKNIPEAHNSIGQVVESANTAIEVYQLAQKLKIDMPITEQIYHVIHHDLTPQAAVKALFSRSLKAE